MLYQVLKREAQPSVLGLDTTRIANFLNYLTLFYISTFLTFRLFWLRKTVVKFMRVCIRYTGTR